MLLELNGYRFFQGSIQQLIKMGNDLAACALSLLVLAKPGAGEPSVSTDEDGNLHINTSMSRRLNFAM